MGTPTKIETRDSARRESKDTTIENPLRSSTPDGSSALGKKRGEDPIIILDSSAPVNKDKAMDEVFKANAEIWATQFLKGKPLSRLYPWNGGQEAGGETEGAQIEEIDNSTDEAAMGAVGGTLRLGLKSVSDEIEERKRKLAEEERETRELEEAAEKMKEEEKKRKEAKKEENRRQDEIAEEEMRKKKEEEERKEHERKSLDAILKELEKQEREVKERKEKARAEMQLLADSKDKEEGWLIAGGAKGKKKASPKKKEGQKEKKRKEAEEEREKTQKTNKKTEKQKKKESKQ